MGIVEVADRVWNGEEPVLRHVMGSGREIDEVADDLAFIAAFSNVMPIRTDDGLVLVDTSMGWSAPTIFETVRSWDPAPLHTAIYTHGHVDHVGGVGPFEAEAEASGWARPTVVAHEAVATRFDRYLLTRGYNSIINQRQFSNPAMQFPTEWRYPDTTFEDQIDLTVGGVHMELRHARGETDDHAWVFLPERKALYPGDLFIWCAPNAGNPQKVQRYAWDWAVALREMQACGAEVLLPSHGLPIVGADRVSVALGDTAELLESLQHQTLALMNDGARLNDILHTVRVPEHLAAKPYLQPVYDDPEFVVRNIWRLYGGWYDGDPAMLKPAPASALATEIASLAGGAAVLAERALALADAGDLRLAGHLAELASQAAPDDGAIHAARADVNQRRVAVETSLMAKGIFGHAARDSAGRADG